MAAIAKTGNLPMPPQRQGTPQSITVAQIDSAGTQCAAPSRLVSRLQQVSFSPDAARAQHSTPIAARNGKKQGDVVPITTRRQCKPLSSFGTRRARGGDGPREGCVCVSRRQVSRPTSANQVCFLPPMVELIRIRRLTLLLIRLCPAPLWCCAWTADASVLNLSGISCQSDEGPSSPSDSFGFDSQPPPLATIKRKSSSRGEGLNGANTPCARPQGLSVCVCASLSSAFYAMSRCLAPQFCGLFPTYFL